MNNLLNQAHQLIPYRENTVLSPTLAALRHPTCLMWIRFAPAVTIEVKINAVGTRLIKKMGLDYKKNYARLFSTPRVSGLTRVNDGDQFEFDGKRWQIETATGWMPTAGWDSFFVVEIPKR